MPFLNFPSIYFRMVPSDGHSNFLKAHSMLNFGFEVKNFYSYSREVKNFYNYSRDDSFINCSFIIFIWFQGAISKIEVMFAIVLYVFLLWLNKNIFFNYHWCWLNWKPFLNEFVNNVTMRKAVCRQNYGSQNKQDRCFHCGSVWVVVSKEESKEDIKK